MSAVSPVTEPLYVFFDSLLVMHVDMLCVVATSSSQGLSDQVIPRYGSSSSLASSACSVQSGCTEKTVDNLSMKEGRCDSILDGRYLITLPYLVWLCFLTCYLASATTELSIYMYKCWNDLFTLWNACLLLIFDIVKVITVYCVIA